MIRSCWFLFGVLLILSANLIVYADTPVSGNVSGVWDINGSPYLVMGDLTVPNNQTLEILPGVQVIFQDHYLFTVNGVVRAQGTAADSIEFTSLP
jgi:hypothetical protein